MKLTKQNVSVVVAIIAAIASGVGAGISVYGSYSVERLKEEYARTRESATFIQDQIKLFYQPISMHLIVTKGLFSRLLETTNEREKVAIEKLMRKHNSSVRDLLMNGAIYLEPGTPEAVSSGLLEHLVQWEVVYQLKYEYGVYKGPVFAGIEEFGFRGFPSEVPGFKSVDEYYLKTTEKLKEKLHRRVVGR